MKTRNYLKEQENKDKQIEIIRRELGFENFNPSEIIFESFQKKKFLFVLLSVALMFLVTTTIFIVNKKHDLTAIQDFNLENIASAVNTGQTDIISIPSGVVKANPFLPYRDIDSTAASDVPQYDIVEPPDMVNESSEAARLMDTTVSGILYDKYSPSAILNIEGNDYLVKKGDVVNNYKVLNIQQDCVTVKLGNNTYKAGIGEILTEGTLNYNDIPNINNKFGGKNNGTK